jgi:hypothetical protein
LFPDAQPHWVNSVQAVSGSAFALRSFSSSHAIPAAVADAAPARAAPYGSAKMNNASRTDQSHASLLITSSLAFPRNPAKIPGFGPATRNTMDTEDRLAPSPAAARALKSAPVPAAPRTVTISPLGCQFAAYLCRLNGEPDPAVAWAARLACQAVAEGHVCFRLEKYAGSEITPDSGEPPAELTPLAEWLERLRQSRLVGRPGDFAPLILDGHRLYLARYWNYEKKLSDQLLVLAKSPCESVDLARLRSDLDRLFAHNRETPDRQKLAAAVV